MSRKGKYSYQEKVKACQDYYDGKRSAAQIANDFGLKKLPGSMWRWFNSYRENGASSLLPKASNSTHSEHFKIKVVKEYIERKGSAEFLAVKYNISAPVLYNWISLYNSDMGLKDYNPKRRSIWLKQE